jgi:hypothetical protein
MPTTFEIHPAIGIARVGTSDEFFIGPEPDVPPDLRRRDLSGRLLRQAARFRIYRCERDAGGVLLAASEILAGDAQIRWSVHAVNRKAAAKRFRGEGRRNNASGDDTLDAELIINPGIRDNMALGSSTKFDTGRFRGKPVSLGSAIVEPDGRLVVLGGFGVSAGAPGVEIVNFADNDLWHDDVCDGPVRATLRFPDNSAPAVAPAWIVVAPPDFAPELFNLITLYDLMLDLAVQRGLRSVPETIGFRQHVRPILERAQAYQWVNKQARKGFTEDANSAHGENGTDGDFAANMAVLGNPETGSFMRRKIVRLLRNPDPDAVPSDIDPEKQMPRLNDDENSGLALPLTSTMFNILTRWGRSEFVTDAGASAELLPDALTRTALEACAGGALFPGIEAGRILRDQSIYMPGEPYRLDPSRLKPGDITAQNAVPWQADFHLCRWEEQLRLGWWPAQRPDDVMTAQNAEMVAWSRGLVDQSEEYVKHWHRLGFVMRDLGDPSVFLERERDPTLDDGGIA